MDADQPSALALAAVQFRAEDLARRTVDFHRVRQAEARSRERYGRRYTSFPWSDAVSAVLSDEALEDEASVVALIKELGRQGCSEVALAALDLVLSRGSPAASKAMFDAAILVCAAEYQDARCVSSLRRMQSLGLFPDLGTANLVLSGLCVRGRLEAAVELLAEMKVEMGLKPNSYSVLMVLQACNYKRRGAYREAIDAVQALEAGGRTANEEVIEALLQVCEAAMHQAPSFESALAVFQALQELHLADCTRIYNGLLGAAGRAGRWREAHALYGQMQDDDIPASLDTHTALIQACVVGRALDHALDIFEHLVAGRSAHEAVPASITTYNHLIHACHQAGLLEKALEIAAWVQKTGVEFDDETYGELMATIEVAQLWDDKAMKQTRRAGSSAMPRQLRPAPYDAMRVMYLDHLESLQQEELLAAEKLGGAGSWAPRSLTRGSVPPGALRPASTPPVTTCVSAASSMRSLGSRAGAATRTPPTPISGGASGGLGWGYDPPTGRSSRSPSPIRGPRGRNLSMRPSPGTSPGASPHYHPLILTPQPQGPGPGDGGSSGGMQRPGPPSRAVSPAPAAGPDQQPLSRHQSRAASVRQLLKALSARPLPVLGGAAAGGGGGGGSGLGGMSFRSSASAAPGPPAAPTGFHEPPTWAQLQTMDAATAGPGGTPFTALPLQYPPSHGGRGGSGAGDEAPLPLVALAVEPANLYGQSSPASLASGTAGSTSRRGSVRNLRVLVSSPTMSGIVQLPALGGIEPMSPAVQVIASAASTTGASPSTAAAVVSGGQHSPAGILSPGPVGGGDGGGGALARQRTRNAPRGATSGGGVQERVVFSGGAGGGGGGPVSSGSTGSGGGLGEVVYSPPLVSVRSGTAPSALAGSRRLSLAPLGTVGAAGRPQPTTAWA